MVQIFFQEMAVANSRKEINSQIGRAKQFLTEIELQGKKINQFKCNVCKRSKILSGKTPSNLVAHFKNTHPEVFYEHIATKVEDSIPVRRLRTVYSCVEMVALSNCPFSVLSSIGFRNALEEKIRVFNLAGCPLNLSDHHVHEIKEKVREVAKDIRNLIKSEVRGKIISVMIDSATRNGRSILGINIQYKFNGTLKVVTLAMCELKSSHTAEYLAGVLLQVFDEYGIELAQIISITTDNGANMLALVKDVENILIGGEKNSDEVTPHNDLQPTVSQMPESANFVDGVEIESDIEALLKDKEISDDDALDLMLDESIVYGELMDKLVLNIRKRAGNHHLFVTSIKCAAHTLQLVIHDAIGALQNSEQNVIALCRQAAKFMRLQSTRNEMRRAGLISILPALDNATRWSSTYMMVS